MTAVLDDGVRKASRKMNRSGARAPSPATRRDPSERPDARLAPNAYKRRLPHLQPERATLFVTFATWQRWVLPVGTRRVVLEHVVRDSELTYRLHAAVVMPDHVHMLISPMSDAAGATYGIAQIMQRLKGASAHSVNEMLMRHGRVWQPEYFDRVLRSDERLRAVGEYICLNPVRAAPVTTDDDWPWLWREWVEGCSADADTRTAGEGARAPFCGGTTSTTPAAGVTHVTNAR